MWNGMFRPVGPELVKHSLGSGDIKNHLLVASVEQIDAAPEDGLARETLGSGQYMFLVAVSFAESNGGPYEFILLSDNIDPSEEEIFQAVVDYFSS